MNEISPAPQLNGQLSVVLFNEDPLVLAEHNAQPYVVMRALVTAMGLTWPTQYVKLMEKFGSTVTEIATVAEDGKPRSMVCLPLRKLPGWLYSINPGKVSEALRPKVLQYQQECDEVLWRHWTKQTPLHRGQKESRPDLVSLIKIRSITKHAGELMALNAMISDAYASLGYPLPADPQLKLQGI